ncbi:hypothetical protein ACFQX8_10565 [Klenkia terrae]|uniref:hypothetical protein n=1 Tax=Klenkia terrae TaxID=1052259 RepID=UPI00360D959B
MTAPTAAPWVLRCPVCSTPVPPGAPPSTPCPTCGLPAAAHAGLVVGRIGVTLADLHRDRDALLATLRTAAPGPRRPPTPPPAPPTPFPYAPAPSAPTHPAPAAGPEPERRRVSPQQVLVGLGALLVVAASLALVAVAWTRFGIGFQAGVMATATAAAAVGSGWAARRGLRATEEGLAATAAALLLVDVGAARSLGLLGLDAVDGRVYAAVAAGVVAVLTAGLAARTRSTLVWPAVALLAAEPVLLLALGDLVDGVLGVAALLVVAVSDGRVAGVLPRWSAEVARVLAGVSAAAAAARAVALAWTGSPLTGAGATALVTAAAVAGGVVLVRRAERGTRPVPPGRWPAWPPSPRSPSPAWCSPPGTSRRRCWPWPGWPPRPPRSCCGPPRCGARWAAVRRSPSSPWGRRSSCSPTARRRWPWSPWSPRSPPPWPRSPTAPPGPPAPRWPCCCPGSPSWPPGRATSSAPRRPGCCWPSWPRRRSARPPPGSAPPRSGPLPSPRSCSPRPPPVRVPRSAPGARSVPSWRSWAVPPSPTPSPGAAP